MSGLTPPKRKLARVSLTTWSLAALACGTALGAAGRASGSPAFRALGAILKPAGDAWIAGLRILALPLVVATLLAAIVRAHGAERVAALAVRAVLVFVAMLVAAGLLTVAVAAPIVSVYRIDAATVESLRAAGSVPPAVRQAGANPISQGIPRILPRSLVEAVRGGEILPILLVTILFAIAVAHLPDRLRLPLARGIQAVAKAMLLGVRWILLATPPGVFVLSYVLALKTGTQAAGILGAFVAIVTGLLIFFTALLYPVTVALGRTDLRSFAKAAAPAQLVAVTTRSSLAALPALVEGGRDALKLPEASTSFVLPLAVSVFKVNRTISSTAKLLFLAHVFRIPLTPGTIATFVATIVLLSFGTAGVPSSASLVTLPAYIAAGIPVEGVLILDAVVTITDIFRTLLNVTGDMSAAVMLSRASRARPGVESPAARLQAAEGEIPGQLR